jgi:hypothetical protein
LNFVEVIDEFVDVATGCWCRCLWLLVVDRVPTEVACTISDADPRAEGECRALAVLVKVNVAIEFIRESSMNTPT